MSERKESRDLDRRDFLKLAAKGAGGMALVMFGLSGSFAATDYLGQKNALLFALDARGDVVWCTRLDMDGVQLTRGVCRGADGTVILCGIGEGDIPWCSKLTAKGVPIWTRFYQERMNARFDAVIPAVDGGCIITGRIGPSSTLTQRIQKVYDAVLKRGRKMSGDLGDAWVVKLSAEGELDWLADTWQKKWNRNEG